MDSAPLTIASEPVRESRPLARGPTLSAAQWGMIAFLLSEVAFFGTLLVAYVAFLDPDGADPTPQILKLPLVLGNTFCLLASSVTVHFAEQRWHAGARRGFFTCWLATIALGLLFLAGTAYEWHHLISQDGLTLSTNLFGSTFYTLVGFHALHVSVGIVALAIVFGLSVRRPPPAENSPNSLGAHGTAGVQLVGWYWHFVDTVWLIVFAVVYVFGR
ncbi:MAG TPA: heme-copper oxidase subunit III [Pirellulales bacterium]|jgi:cytochrome c oxidase subunit 3/cytochrome o ubiquinol oxidase subunit 3|nr:heme-copper oxidase subunit III [Pirellulales bacterium]